MDKEKITKDLEKIRQQINNLETINEKSDISIDIPNNEVLEKLIEGIKTFGNTERNMFLQQISKTDGMNSNNKKFTTMKTDQRSFLLEKLNEKAKDIELLAKEA